MQELKELVISAQSGSVEAFDQLVCRFQDMAVAYGYAVLGDFHRAEDAAQEAFVEAFRCLPQLQEPFAFPGWLRCLVFKHCDRQRRKRRVPIVPLEDAVEHADSVGEPFEVAEQQEMALQVRRAVAALPEHERSVTVLFYLGQHSQQQIADFLEVPVTTVKGRLFSARKKLKQKMIQMTQENFEEKRPSRNADFGERVKRFTDQFSQRIDAGQSIVRSLAALAEQEQNSAMRQVIAQIQQDITGDGQNGATLSEALAKHPEMFSQSYVEAIRQGEVNGNLKVVLREIR